MYSRIVVPLDGSELGERAIPHAAALARAFGARLYLVMVVSRYPEIEASRVGELSGAAVDLGREHGRRLVESLLGSSREYLEKTMAGLRGQGLDVETALLQGEAGENIVKFSQERKADLIVMSTRGLGGIRRLLVGSVADRVIRSATAPVLAIPPEEG